MVTEGVKNVVSRFPLKHQKEKKMLVFLEHLNADGKTASRLSLLVSVCMFIFIQVQRGCGFLFKNTMNHNVS